MKPSGAEVRRVRAQDRAGALAQRRRVVAQPRAVGGPDLDQARAGLRDDLGDAKAAADLDELPARDDDLAARPGQRRGGEQHRGGAVVDRQRRPRRPVTSRSSASTCAWREPRSPVARSSSRFE